MYSYFTSTSSYTLTPGYQNSFTRSCICVSLNKQENTVAPLATQLMLCTEAVAQRCSVKKVFSDLRPQACNFVKKENLAQVFSYEFCEISKNTFFTEQLWVTASVHNINCVARGATVFSCLFKLTQIQDLVKLF